jgi:hypothetical protein
MNRLVSEDAIVASTFTFRYAFIQVHRRLSIPSGNIIVTPVFPLPLTGCSQDGTHVLYSDVVACGVEPACYD